MPSYLIEEYVPRSTRIMRDARKIADELAREGVAIRYVRATFLPDDETCFHHVEASSPEDVAELCRRAGLGRARVVTAVES